MAKTLTPADLGKRAAAERALDYVRDGMRIGLGTGSTADWFVRLLGERMRDGVYRDIVGVPTSIRTGELAESLRIPQVTLDEAGWLDVTVDGADELDDQLTLIKGGGGALLQEKIVATASDMMVVIADPSKRVRTIGAFPLPIEITPFGWETTRSIVEAVLKEADVDAAQARLRMKGDTPFITDGGHMILDLHLHRIGAPRRLHADLLAVPGVVETGLFIDIADVAIIGHADGPAEVLTVTRD
ncbi:MAG: ribose-5-phosphate isomerase RpiA [Rubrimonas sp.]